MLMSEKKQKCTSPQDVANIINAILDFEGEFSRTQEHFYVIGLNKKNVVQFIELVSLGTVGETIVHPREVFKMLIIKSCSYFIAVHNHPSGDIFPSNEDFAVTKRLKECGELIGIPIIDHIIIGENFFSFKENNNL